MFRKIFGKFYLFYFFWELFEEINLFCSCGVKIVFFNIGRKKEVVNVDYRVLKKF